MATFSARRAEYAALWASAVVRPDRMPEVRARARQIMAARPRYDPVSKATGVPWFVIGILHSMECSLSFNKHLHNGDPVTRGGKPAATVRVPKGRGPFASWEESAIDALKYDKLDKITDWSVERIAFALEKFNGFGYLNKGVHSPYLWSATTAYEKGKYVQDGVWSSVAVSQQSGGMAILKALIELDPSQVDIDAGAKAEEVWAKTPTPPATSSVSEAPKSKSVWAIGGSVGLWLGKTYTNGVQWLSDWVGSGAEMLELVNKDVEGGLAPITALARTLQFNIGGIISTIAVALAVVAIARHSRDKAELRRLQALVPAEGKGD